MTNRLLKPRVDIVFKMLFVENPTALREMLEAVLGEPLGDLEILNPIIPGDLTTEKNIVLDLRVAKADGTRISVEMQIRARDEQGGRLAYYAARDYSKQLKRGQSYAELTATIVIVWLVERLFPRRSECVHRIFELREPQSGELLTDTLAIHVLQLQDFAGPPPAGENLAARALRSWARFLALESNEQLQQLIAEETNMAGVAQTLERLSDDPERARLAQEREEDLLLFEILRNKELARAQRHAEAEGRAQGMARGIAEGMAQGILEGTRRALHRQLERRFGALAPDLARCLSAATEAELDAWGERILSASKLSDVFANDEPRE